MRIGFSLISALLASVAVDAWPSPAYTIFDNLKTLAKDHNSKDYELSTLLKLLDSYFEAVAPASIGDVGKTLFAPTDAAFKAFVEANPDVYQALEEDPTKLGDVLLFHTSPDCVDPAK
ncbi:hypothetical protein BDK51DRAFT_29502, partial [Blyttiomyces helicus]